MEVLLNTGGGWVGGGEGRGKTEANVGGLSIMIDG